LYIRLGGFELVWTQKLINRSHVLEVFATVSVELSVHTGYSHSQSLQHEPTKAYKLDKRGFFIVPSSNNKVKQQSHDTPMVA
jgi:hypothetical protein